MKNHEIIEVKTKDIEMNVIRFGSGRKNMVILPGISLRSVCDSAEAIAFQYKRFWEDYTVYVFDRKKNIRPGYSVREMAKDTGEAMKELKITDAYVFGASQGGMMAMFMMTDYPSLIKKSVLASSFARPNETSLSVIGYWAELARKHDVVSLNHDCFQKIYSKAYLEKYKSAFTLLEKLGTDSDCDRMAVLCDACNDMEVYDELDKIKCPVLVAGAKNDEIITVEGVTEVGEKLGCEMYIYDGYSHAVYDEAPDFPDRIFEFFAKEI